MPVDPIPGFDPPGMNPELKAKLKELYGHTRDRQVTNTALSLDATRERADQQVEAVVADAYRLLANLVKASPARAEHACASGCSWCCHQLVRISAVEAIALAEALREAYPSDWLLVIRERLAKQAAVIAQIANPLEYHAARVTCAFLSSEGECAVYEWRPLVCRGFHSLSRSACEERYVEVTAPTPPIDSYSHLAAIAVLHGVSLAVGAAGRDHKLYELHAAVGRALDTVGAPGRWARGEDLFRGLTNATPVAPTGINVSNPSSSV